ncbi:MAG: hypothetical protein MUE53_02230 [Chitinophagales bacterium]|jgi:hypothetical protein|nr:hypothetical protein [Chitinophagales bacterium]
MRYLAFIYLLTYYFSVSAQVVDYNPYIEKEKKRIDGFDGRIDGKIALPNDPKEETLYQFVYRDLVDSFQKRVNQSKTLLGWQKRNLLFGLSSTLSEINTFNYRLPLYYQKIFQNAFGILGAEEHRDLNSFLITDPVYSIKNMYFYMYNEECTEFLYKAVNLFPDEILKAHYKYQDRPFADTLIQLCAIVAPEISKNYLLAESKVKKILHDANHKNIMGMRGFFYQYNILSKGMVLVDDIVEGNLTIEEAHAISLNKRTFLRKLIALRNSDYSLAKHSIDNELKSSSLQFIRVVNDLHNESDKVRFASLDDFNWKELYTVMVHSEEEIFTSTFNGCFERLLIRIKQSKINGYEMLEQTRFNRFRSFIKLCAGYGKLNKFLETMPKDKQKILIKKFTQNLEVNDGELRDAINVADAFGSVKDPVLLKEIQQNIAFEFARVNTEKNKQGQAIYGLLSSLFIDNKTKDSSWFKTISEKYKLKPIDKIAIKDLINDKKIHNQVHFFYDDEDGYASYTSFIATFSNANYKLTKIGNYSLIESVKGNKVRIFANEPKSELEGQSEIITMIDSLNLDIKMMVHRGHSYYAMNTIDQMPSSTKIVFLGSCGSYNNIHEVIQKVNDVHIISSKQIGTMSVNNPLLYIISETIRENRDIDWSEIWKKLGNQVKANAYANEKYADYVPPHKNLGAIFLQAYKQQIVN